MNEEIWKDIEGYEGIYQVSNLGRVRSLDRYVTCSNGTQMFIKGRIKTPSYNKRCNIYEVHLRKDNKRQCLKVYRLVAKAFIENDDPINKTTVNHKDGDRSNNRADNLEWASYSENLKHAYDELHRPKNATKIKRRHCISINKHTNERVVYDSIEAASRGSGVSCTQIRRIAINECINKYYYFIVEGIND